MHVNKLYKMSKISIILLLILLLSPTIYYQKTYTTLSFQIPALRGIFAPSCFWLNKYYNTYQELYSFHGDFPIFYFEKVKYFIPTDITYIKQILELTPSIFKQQQYKYNFFKQFIGYNVDTVTGCPWKSQRVLNEKVLIVNYLRKYAYYYNKTIQTLLEPSIPQNYTEFRHLSKQMISKIIFNKDKIPNKVSKFLVHPDTIFSTTYQKNKLTEETLRFIRKFLLNELHFSKPLSLLSLCKDTHLTKDELIEKIPPWIFPIASLIHTTIPQILTYVIHNNKMDILRKELQFLDLTDTDAICKTPFLRQCIFETMRLNCPSSATVRVLSKPFTYNKDKTFYKYSQFILLNKNILHNKQCFEQPQQFIPERWTEETEMLYSSLIFNQGPHHCPWKYIAIFIMSSFIAHYLNQANILTGENTIVTHDSVYHMKKYGFTLRSRRK